MNFVEINGSEGEGGGQILRTAISLACVLNKPIRITRIRAGRNEPGLRPQHLMAVKSVAQICNGTLTGGSIGSTEIQFVPGSLSSSISSKFDIGTAGSISLLAQTLIPIGILRSVDLDLEITGGTEVPFSPTIDFLQRVALPAYERIGCYCSIRTLRRGYFPRGGGRARLQVQGKNSKLHPLELDAREDSLKECTILSVSRLLPSHVTERQVNSARSVLKGEIAEIKTEVDSLGATESPGSSCLIYSITDSKFIGAGSLGERTKSSEEVGKEAAKEFLHETRLGASVDSHLADMVPTILSCIRGKSSFTTSHATEHLNTNLRIAKKLTGCDYEISECGRKVAINIVGRSENSN